MSEKYPPPDSTANHRLVIESNLINKRIDVVISLLNKSISRSQAQKLIGNGYVTINGVTAKPSYRVEENDIVELEVPAAKPSHLAAQNIPLQIVFEDDDILVIDKPAGLVVHPAPGHPDQTIVNALIAYLPQLPNIGGEERPGIVHRLDKDTSGLMIVAKTSRAYVRLLQMMKNHMIDKYYLALIEGHPGTTSGTIQADIGRDTNNRLKMSVVKRGGKAAVTHFWVEKEFSSRTLLRIKLETGRTHQIRVHLAAINHPIVGDITYGFKKDPMPARQFLHASELQFTHPVSNEMVHVKSEFPADLALFIRKIEP